MSEGVLLNLRLTAATQVGLEHAQSGHVLRGEGVENGDLLVAVNGALVHNTTYLDCIALVKAAKTTGSYVLTVRRGGSSGAGGGSVGGAAAVPPAAVADDGLRRSSSYRVAAGSGTSTSVATSSVESPLTWETVGFTRKQSQRREAAAAEARPQFDNSLFGASPVSPPFPPLPFSPMQQLLVRRVLCWEEEERGERGQRRG